MVDGDYSRRQQYLVDRLIRDLDFFVSANMRNQIAALAKE